MGKHIILARTTSKAFETILEILKSYDKEHEIHLRLSKPKLALIYLIAEKRKVLFRQFRL